MSGYRWRAGFRPPKGVEPEAVAEAIDDLAEATPENLLEASKRKRHVLHEELWGEGDQVWAQRGRLNRAREIMRSVAVEVAVGGITVETRAFESVNVDGGRQYLRIEEIAQDRDLLDDLFGEIQRCALENAAKMARIRAFVREFGVPAEVEKKAPSRRKAS